MTCKQDERKALEEIRKIIDGLGKDSYIGIAFEGCLEIAEQNIDNDFACSMRQRAESAERINERLSAQLAAKDEQIKSMQVLCDSHGRQSDEYCRINKALKDELDQARDTSVNLWNDLRAAEKTINDQAEQIVHLKAKLYDLMCPPENMPLSTNSGLQSLEELLGNG